MHRILLVANARAGTAEQEPLDAALAVLRRRAEVEVARTATPDELDELLARLDGRDVVVAGGDGTLHAVVNALHRHGALEGTRLGLVPLGTGNDFARGVGLPDDPAEAAALVTEGTTTEVDLIVDDGGVVVVNNAHLGVGAQASRAAGRWKPRLGRLGYAVGALAAGARPAFVRVRVTVDDREVMPYRRVAQVAVGNGSSVGGGTELIPGAHPFNGELTVIVSRPRSWLRRFTYAVRLHWGTHHLMKEVERTTGRTVTVAGEEFHLVSDGEVTGPHTRRTWSVLPGAVTMFLPPAPPPDAGR